MTRQMPNGDRLSTARTAAAQLAEQAPQAMREYLAPYVPEYCESLLEAMRTPHFTTAKGDVVSNPAHRTALGLIAQILKAIGAQVELTINLWQRLGVSDEMHARSMIDSALRASELDHETAWRLSEQFVQDYRRQHGLPELVEARSVAALADVVGDESPTQGKT